MQVVYKTFKNPSGFYLYDRTSNSIIKLNEDEFNFFDKYQEDQEINDSPMLNRYQKFGFLKENRLEKIENPLNSSIDLYTQNSVKQLVLQVTQNCNFRCNYCAFSGSYTNRVHNNKRMDLETALQAIDFYMSHSHHSRIKTIGFYGGEPLLEIELIQNCVEYITNNFGQDYVNYTVTTNGYLLDDHIIDLFYRHNFNVLISLDGPAHIHDKNRKTAGGVGTFNTIIHNLWRIKERYPEYYKERIGFNPVIDTEIDFSETVEFFDNHPLTKGLKHMFSNISDEYAIDEIKYGEKFSARHRFEFFKALMAGIGKIKESDLSNLYESVLDNYKDKYWNLQPTINPQVEAHHAGLCIPGVTKLFVSAYGDFYACEKASESSEVMKIGSIDTGYDIHKIIDLMNVGKLTAEECKTCWCFNLCNVCFIMADNTQELSREKKLRFCERSKFSASNLLQDICLLKAYNFDFGSNDHEKIINL